MQASSRRLGEFLVERKVLSRDDLEHALAIEASDGVPLAKILISEQLVGERDMVAAIAHQMGIPFFDFEHRPVNPMVDRLIPAELARRHMAVAVDIDGTELLVAMEDPSDQETVQQLQEVTGWAVKPVLAVRSDVRALVSAMYGAQGGGIELDLSGAADVRASLDDPAPTDLHINELLERVVDLGGSDLHLTSGIHPSVRVHGDIKPLTEFPEMNGSEIRRMLYGILTQKQREKFENELELDTSHSVPGVGRFRVNVFLQRDSMGAVMRTIPYEIVPLHTLGLPPSLSDFANLPRA